jgi:hypothetical protein
VFHVGKNKGAMPEDRSPLLYFKIRMSLRYFTGCTITQAVSRESLSAETSVRARVIPCEICGRQSDTRAGYSSELFGFPLSVSFHRRSSLIHHLGDEEQAR